MRTQRHLLGLLHRDHLHGRQGQPIPAEVRPLQAEGRADQVLAPARSECHQTQPRQGAQIGAAQLLKLCWRAPLSSGGDDDQPEVSKLDKLLQGAPND